MRIVRKAAPMGLALAALGVMVSIGCGILTAPVTVPMAVASSAFFSFSGRVMDQEGRPLNDVLMNQKLHHVFWEPMNGQTTTDEPKMRQVNGNVEVLERGEDMTLKFSKVGYYDTEFRMDARHADVLTTDGGNWKNVKDFPVVMYTRGTDAEMNAWAGSLNYEKYPLVPLVELGAMGAKYQPTAPRSVEVEGGPGAGMFYMTVVESTPHVINSKGEVDAMDVSIPETLTLHIGGGGAGFVRIEPRMGFDPMRSADFAPSSGYVPELVITHVRLKEMVMALGDGIENSREYFVFRYGDRYGKGYVSYDPCTCHGEKGKEKEPVEKEFYAALWIQSQWGDTNITTHAPERP